jgi:hypothetical protein
MEQDDPIILVLFSKKEGHEEKEFGRTCKTLARIK